MPEDLEGALQEAAKNEETRWAILEVLPGEFDHPSEADFELLRHLYVETLSFDIDPQKEYESAKLFCDEWFRQLELELLPSLSSLQKYFELAVLYNIRYGEYEEQNRLNIRLDLIQNKIELLIDFVSRNTNISRPLELKDLDELMGFIEKFNEARPLNQIDYYRHIIEQLILKKIMEFRDAGKRGVWDSSYTDEDVRKRATQILAVVERHDFELNVESWVLETEACIEDVQEVLALLENLAETDQFEKSLEQRESELQKDIGYVYRASHIPQICLEIQAPKGYNTLQEFAEAARRRLESAKLNNLSYRFNVQAAALIVDAQAAVNNYSAIEPAVEKLLQLFREAGRLGEAEPMRNKLQTFLEGLIEKEVQRCKMATTPDNAEQTGVNLTALGKIAARVKQYLTN